MDADVVGDDELQPRQAHPIAGNGGQMEGLLWIAHIHQDAGAGGRQIGDRLLLQVELQGAGVHVPLLPFAAAQGHRVAVVEAPAAINAAHDRGDAHLAGDDRGVAGAAALVGHHAPGPLQDRLPVGIGALGHQQIPRLEPVDLARVAEHPHHAAADGGPDRPSAHHRHDLVGLEVPAAQHGAVAA